jgi:uncharacterized membrane protein (DUF4010 family)
MNRSGLLERVSRDEVMASLRFAALIFVLFLLPDEELDVLFGLNPQRIWLVVVFVAGLSFFGYLLAKIVDPRTAIGVMGMLGGCVSPGLTIISFMEQTKRYAEFVSVYAFAAAIAVTMLFPRNFIVIGIVSPSLALSLLIPFAAMAGVSVTVAGLGWSHIRMRNPPISEMDTPFQIRPALATGAVVAAILLVINNFEVSIPTDATRIGIVLATVAELMGYTGVTWAAGMTKMARVIAVILLGSAGFGVTIVFLT